MCVGAVRPACRFSAPEKRRAAAAPSADGSFALGPLFYFGPPCDCRVLTPSRRRVPRSLRALPWLSAAAAKMAGTFEVDMTKYKEVKVDPWASETLPADVKQQLLQNIEVCRDAVVFFTACGSASGYGGHTGGAFDTVRNFVLRPALL